MKDKTIANFLAGSFGLALLGSFITENQNLLFTIAGAGLIVFGILAALRLRKHNNKDWLFIALLVSEGLAVFSLMIMGSMSDIINLAFWVFGIWAVVRLYKLSKTN